MSDMPPDPFATTTHTCTTPEVPTETLSEIVRERFRRVDECVACALGAMEARQDRKP